MTLYIGSDHAGFKLKEYIKKVLEELNATYSDEGTYTDKSSDYSFYAKEVATQVKKNNAKGILICGTGIGMSIAANKVKGIRAALVHSTKDSKLSRSHNDANILVLSAKTSKPKTKQIIQIWLKTKFSNAVRHKRRIAALE